MDHKTDDLLSQNLTSNDNTVVAINEQSTEKTEEDTETLPSKDNDESAPVFECPVCLQTASFPVQLPCRHIFCFLCVKGVANRSKRCAMCRQEIPADFFHDPKLLRSEEVSEKSKTIFDEGFQWFYEGRNGWWQYDERTSQELENKYKSGEKMFELLIAGFLYVIDLENMRQFRRNDQTRRRKMKRDMCNIPGIKGIAGIKYHDSQQLRPSGDGGEASNTVRNAPLTTNSISPSNQPSSLPTVMNDRGPIGAQDDSYPSTPAPNNTPQAPMTPADSQPSSLSNSQEDLSLHLQTLHLSQPLLGRSRPESPEHHLDDVHNPLYEHAEGETEEDTDDETSDENNETVDYQPSPDDVRETCL